MSIINGVIKTLSSKFGITLPITVTSAVKDATTGESLDVTLNNINNKTDKIGNLSELPTTEKGSLVGAVTELNSHLTDVSTASCTIANSDAFKVERSSISLYKHAGIVGANIILYIVSVAANNTISVGTVPDGYRPIANINIPVVLVAGTSIFGYGMLIINTSGDVTLRTNIAVSSSAPRVATSSTTYISA